MLNVVGFVCLMGFLFFTLPAVALAVVLDSLAPLCLPLGFLVGCWLTFLAMGRDEGGV